MKREKTEGSTEGSMVRAERIIARCRSAQLKPMSRAIALRMLFAENADGRPITLGFDHIADDFGCDRRTVSDAIVALLECGIFAKSVCRRCGIDEMAARRAEYLAAEMRAADPTYNGPKGARAHDCQKPGPVGFARTLVDTAGDEFPEFKRLPSRRSKANRKHGDGTHGAPSDGTHGDPSMAPPMPHQGIRDDVQSAVVMVPPVHGDGTHDAPVMVPPGYPNGYSERLLNGDTPVVASAPSEVVSDAPPKSPKRKPKAPKPPEPPLAFTIADIERAAIDNLRPEINGLAYVDSDTREWRSAFDPSLAKSITAVIRSAMTLRYTIDDVARAFEHLNSDDWRKSPVTWKSLATAGVLTADIAKAKAANAPAPKSTVPYHPPIKPTAAPLPQSEQLALIHKAMAALRRPPVFVKPSTEVPHTNPQARTQPAPEDRQHDRPAVSTVPRRHGVAGDTPVAIPL